jgi:hypothetical protein
MQNAPAERAENEEGRTHSGMNTAGEHQFCSISPGLVLTSNEKDKNSDGIRVKS